MAATTNYGTNFTKFDQNVPKEQVNVAEHGARLRVQYDAYETDGNEGAGSTIAMARMPKGARVWQVILVTDDIHASATLQVGDSSDPNRFITESICGDDNKVHYMHPKAHASDGNVTLLGGASGTGIDGFGYAYTAETDIIITTASATLAASKTINLCIFYSLD
jgi:hypothetical protein